MWFEHQKHTYLMRIQTHSMKFISTILVISYFECFLYSFFMNRNMLIWKWSWVEQKDIFWKRWGSFVMLNIPTSLYQIISLPLKHLQNWGKKLGIWLMIGTNCIYYFYFAARLCACPYIYCHLFPFTKFLNYNVSFVLFNPGRSVPTVYCCDSSLDLFSRVIVLVQFKGFNCAWVKLK